MINDWGHCLIITLTLAVVLALSFVGLLFINNTSEYDGDVWRISAVLMVGVGMCMVSTTIWLIVTIWFTIKTS